ncbi:uncharacterized protein B0I36DRAFT_359829 [Microdochium trichocladiopsis]|uniref:Uncharacterized protein n=1 Tax=Microdochium trichocladiopsis TaxID=1682393 RepID=A0A9P8YFW9_9PEZI|nr:uncharacterized protein B0I36DRAFT_359829 [Microdochium trichocladiopsis]KAH7038241.1 hypothetical protein B0I36DRAFT_359829 [Microdochium trichocladiopsis]
MNTPPPDDYPSFADEWSETDSSSGSSSLPECCEDGYLCCTGCFARYLSTEDWVSLQQLLYQDELHGASPHLLREKLYRLRDQQQLYFAFYPEGEDAGDDDAREDFQTWVRRNYPKSQDEQDESPWESPYSLPISATGMCDVDEAQAHDDERQEYRAILESALDEILQAGSRCETFWSEIPSMQTAHSGNRSAEVSKQGAELSLIDKYFEDRMNGLIPNPESPTGSDTDGIL